MYARNNIRVISIFVGHGVNVMLFMLKKKNSKK